MSIATDELVRQAFPVLDQDAVALLQLFGEQRVTRAGDAIFEAGKDQPSLVVVLAGRTETVDRSDGTDRPITGAGPGEFVGELGLLTGQTAYATCVVREPGEVLVVPVSGVQAAIATFPVLSDILVAAFSARR